MLEQRSWVRTSVGGLPSQGTIGTSQLGSPLDVEYRGKHSDDLAVRLAVIAGQRGNETLSRLAISGLAETTATLSDGQSALALLMDLNPDGAATNTSNNAQGVDLARDHLRLAAPETQCCHRFIRDWCPHLVVVLDTYQPQELTANDRQFWQCHDLVVDFATNLAVNHPLRGAENLELVEPLIGVLAESGFLAGRSIHVTPDGLATHGTCDLREASNGLALRYRVPVVNLAGRLAPQAASQTVDRTLAALAVALRWLMEWSERNSFLLTAPQPPGYDSVPLGSRPVEDPTGCLLAVQDCKAGQIREMELPHRYAPVIEETHRVRLPAAYAVHAQQGELIQLLAHHGFTAQRADYRRTVISERYWIAEQGDGTRSFHPHTEARMLEDHILYPVSQMGGHALALMLEPESQHGLARYPELGLARHPSSYYPVVRLAG